MNWLILRVFAGQPLHVERAINDVGLAKAYCPAEIVERPHPKGKEIIRQRKPLIPGYVFTDREFEVGQIPAALLARAKARAAVRDRPNQPLTTHIHTRFMMWGESYLTIGEREMDRLRLAEMEKNTEPERLRQLISDVSRAVKQICDAVAPRKYVPLGDFQTLAFQGHRGISRTGRAA